jgi:broad specificity phosphatase PhoE
MERSWESIQKPEDKITIHWVRHAESCSNVEVNDLDEGTSASPASPVSPVSPTSKETWWSKIVSTVKAVHSETKTKLYQKTSQPPLTELGMYQASVLGDFIDYDYSAYFCSPSVRTILTLMIALESKYRYMDLRPITINIVDNIIELTNIAGVAGQDKQNQAVPKKNLKIIIGYFRKWLNYNYFNYFSNIDKKFNDLYNEVLTKINNFNMGNPGHPLFGKFSEIIGILVDIDRCDSPDIEFNKRDLLNRCINLINTYVPKDLISQEQIHLLEYYLIPNRFDFIKFRFFETPRGETRSDDMEIFIRLLLENYNKQKVLCVSHGSLLKEHFKILRKLYNTEMIVQDYNGGDIRSAQIEEHPNAKSVSREYLTIKVFGQQLLSKIEKCNKICGNPEYKTEPSQSNSLFSIVSKMSTYPDIPKSTDIILDDHVMPKYRLYPIESGFRYITVPPDQGGYFKKYIKYKSKYLNTKKLINKYT